MSCQLTSCDCLMGMMSSCGGFVNFNISHSNSLSSDFALFSIQASNMLRHQKKGIETVIVAISIKTCFFFYMIKAESILIWFKHCSKLNNSQSLEFQSTFLCPKHLPVSTWDSHTLMRNSPSPSASFYKSWLSGRLIIVLETSARCDSAPDFIY